MPIETLLRVHDSPGADPDVLRVLRIECDRADRLHRLFVEDWLVTRPAIFGFPNAAAGRADKKGDLARRFPCCGNGRNATAHGRGTDIARAEPGDGGGIIGRFLLRRTAATAEDSDER